MLSRCVWCSSAALLVADWKERGYRGKQPPCARSRAQRCPERGSGCIWCALCTGSCAAGSHFGSATGWGLDIGCAANIKIDSTLYCVTLPRMRRAIPSASPLPARCPSVHSSCLFSFPELRACAAELAAAPACAELERRGSWGPAALCVRGAWGAQPAPGRGDSGTPQAVRGLLLSVSVCWGCYSCRSKREPEKILRFEMFLVFQWQCVSWDSTFVLQVAQPSLQVASGRTAENPQGKGGTPGERRVPASPSSTCPGCGLWQTGAGSGGRASGAAGALVSAWLWSACCSTESRSTNPGISPVYCFHREQIKQFWTVRTSNLRGS